MNKDLSKMRHHELMVLLFSLIIELDTYDLRRLIKYIKENLLFF